MPFIFKWAATQGGLKKRKQIWLYGERGWIFLGSVKIFRGLSRCYRNYITISYIILNNKKDLQVKFFLKKIIWIGYKLCTYCPSLSTYEISRSKVEDLEKSHNLNIIKVITAAFYFISLALPPSTHTVGAQSITRFLKKIVFLPQHISGHRHDRELWFFCLIDLDHGYHVGLKKCKKL